VLVAQAENRPTAHEIDHVYEILKMEQARVDSVHEILKLQAEKVDPVYEMLAADYRGAEPQVRPMRGLLAVQGQDSVEAEDKWFAMIERTFRFFDQRQKRQRQR